VGSFFNELKRRNVIRVATAYVVVSWLVIQVVDSILPVIEAPEWVAKTILLILAIGFPIALLFSWAFEMTAGGVKKTSEIDANDSLTHNTGQKLNYIIIGALVLIIGGMAYTGEFSGNSNHANPNGEVIQAEKSVAVLPFVNMSDDADWFSDGLTEEILNSLAALPELAVTARTSSFHFKGENIPVNEIAEKLNVEYIVEGSVRRGGDTLRITAQLIRAGADKHMWSKTYDANSENVLDVQQEVAEQIAVALDVYLDDTRRAEMFDSGTRNAEAFEAFHRANAIDDEAHNGDNDSSLWEAAVLYEQAIKADPKFSAAYQAIQDPYSHFITDGPDGGFLKGRHLEGLTPEIALAKLREYQAKALELANNPARKTSAEFAMTIQGDNWRPINRLLKEIKANPEAIAKAASSTWFVESMALLGESAVIIPALEKRLERDKYRRLNWFYLYAANVAIGEVDKALATSRAGEAYGYGANQGRKIEWLILKQDWATLRAMNEDALAENRQSFLLEYLFGDRTEIGNRLDEQLAEGVNLNDLALLRLNHWAGRQAAADAAASKIDNLPLGVLEFAQYIQTQGSLPVNPEAVPNLVRKYREAGLSEEKINSLIHVPAHPVPK